MLNLGSNQNSKEKDDADGDGDVDPRPRQGNGLKKGTEQPENFLLQDGEKAMNYGEQEEIERSSSSRLRAP